MIVELNNSTLSLAPENEAESKYLEGIFGKGNEQGIYLNLRASKVPFGWSYDIKVSKH